MTASVFRNIRSFQDPNTYLYWNNGVYCADRPHSGTQRASLSKIAKDIFHEHNNPHTEKALLTQVLFQLNFRHKKKYDNYSLLSRTYCTFKSAINNWWHGYGFISSGALVKKTLSDFVLTDLTQWVQQSPSIEEERDEAVRRILNCDSALFLSNLHLSTLPELLGQLTHLKYLSVAFNQLTVLPESLRHLTQLKYLHVAGNNLNDLPSSIGQLTQLEELNVSRNQLTALPESLRQLRKLEILYVQNNRLTSLFLSPEQLTQLVKLDVSINQLTALPLSLARLRRDCYICAIYNRISSVAIQNFQQAVRQVRQENSSLGPDNVEIDIYEDISRPISTPSHFNIV